MKAITFKSLSLICSSLALLLAPRVASAYYVPVNQNVPDGNPVGLASSLVINNLPSGTTVTGVTVGLNLTGGYNGDLYGYLVAPNGVSVNLLNRPGVTDLTPFGAGGSGLNVTLADSAAQSVQTAPETAGAVLSGSYQAAVALTGLNGAAANGTWRLFLEDQSLGGGQAVLNGWSVNFSPVPEPALTMVLTSLVLASVTIGVQFHRRRQARLCA